MATFIRLSSAEAELLRRNRDQVQANRLQKVEADEQAATGQQLQATADEQQTLEQPGGRRQSRFRRDQPAASLRPSTALVVVELFWEDGADYDLNIGRNDQFVGWYFSVKPETAVNDGSIWNQLFWLRDNTDYGPASEFAVFDSTRAPTPGSNYPTGNFTLELFSYCYEELSTQPLTVSVYPVDPSSTTGYNPELGLTDVQRLKALGLSSAQSFTVTVDRFNPEGEKGIKIGEVRFPGPTLVPVTP